MADELENMEPPGYSIPKILATIKAKGVFKAMDDEEMGPHVHLTYLIIMVCILAGIIATVVFVAF
jgi:hypothetical protein